jgi:hypothetical protein
MREVPVDWDQWKAVAYTGKRGDVRLGETFVRADDARSAKELGKRALRLIGIRGRFVVNVMPYYPWCDPAMRLFIAPVKPT